LLHLLLLAVCCTFCCSLLPVAPSVARCCLLRLLLLAVACCYPLTLLSHCSALFAPAHCSAHCHGSPLCSACAPLCPPSFKHYTRSHPVVSTYPVPVAQSSCAVDQSDPSLHSAQRRGRHQSRQQAAAASSKQQRDKQDKTVTPDARRTDGLTPTPLFYHTYLHYITPAKLIHSETKPKAIALNLQYQGGTFNSAISRRDGASRRSRRSRQYSYYPSTFRNRNVGTNDSIITFSPIITSSHQDPEFRSQIQRTNQVPGARGERSASTKLCHCCYCSGVDLSATFSSSWRTLDLQPYHLPYHLYLTYQCTRLVHQSTTRRRRLALRCSTLLYDYDYGYGYYFNTLPKPTHITKKSKTTHTNDNIYPTIRIANIILNFYFTETHPPSAYKRKATCNLHPTAIYETTKKKVKTGASTPSLYSYSRRGRRRLIAAPAEFTIPITIKPRQNQTTQPTQQQPQQNVTLTQPSVSG
jgi:hypothetical protein